MELNPEEEIKIKKPKRKKSVRTRICSIDRKIEQCQKKSATIEHSPFN